MGLQVLFNIHALMKNSDHYNIRRFASTVENDMASMVVFSILWFYVVSMFSKLGLTTKKLKGIIELFKVFIPLAFTPSARGVSSNFNYIFLCGVSK
jgi:hypothetical protein